MKKIILFVAVTILAHFAKAQFTDSSVLKQYITDTIKDRRPDKITAAQVQKAMMGLYQFRGMVPTGTDAATNKYLNWNGTNYVRKQISYGELLGTPTVVSQSYIDSSNAVLNTKIAGKADSVTMASSPNVDTVKWWKGGVSYVAGYVDKKEGRLIGGVVTWTRVGLSFDVTAATYVINGTRYSSPAGTVTLSTADPTNPRIDVIAVDTSGSIVIITGTPSASPSEPQVNPNSQILLTSVLIGAGATTPTGVTSGIVFDENVEWTASASGLTANFANTTNVFSGSKAASLTSVTNGSWVQFVNTVPVSFSAYTALKFYLRLNSVIFLKPNRPNFDITFLNGTTVASSTLNGSTYFDPSVQNAYQNISIPLSAFTFNSSNFDRIRITFYGSNNGYYLDYVQLQSGFNPVPSTGSTPNFQQVLAVGNTTNIVPKYTSNLGSQFTSRSFVDKGYVDSSAGIAHGIDDVLGINQALTTTRLINTGAYSLHLTGSSSGNGVVWATNTGSQAAGFFENTGSGIGIFSRATASSPYHSELTGTATNDIQDVYNSWRFGGTIANGFGSKYSTLLETTLEGTVRTASEVITKWVNATDASRTSEWSVTGVSNAGATQTLLALNGGGQARLNKYGVNTFGGTPAYYLGVDASGNVVESPGSGGGATADTLVTKSPLSFISGTGTTADTIQIKGINAMGNPGESIRVNAAGTAMEYFTPGTPTTSLAIVNDVDYTLPSTVTNVLYKALTAARTVTLGTPTANRMVTITHGGQGAFSINFSASINQNASTSFNSIAQNKWITIVGDGTAWWLVAGN